MYPPRQNTGSQQNQMKITIPDACDRIKEEVTFLTQQIQTLKLECERLNQERADAQRLYTSYYETACTIHLEYQKQCEITKRFATIISQVLSYLPQEHQNTVLSAVERAKQVSMPDPATMMGQGQLMFSGANPMGGFPPGMPGLPQPPVTSVNGNLNTSNSGVSSLLSMPPNPFGPNPITSMANMNTNNNNSNNAVSSSNQQQQPSSGQSGFPGAPPGASNSPGFPQSQSAMAAAMAAMAASLQGNNAAAAAAFGFPLPPNMTTGPNLISNMGAFMTGDKNMDEKQRAAAAAAMAAMTAAVAQQQQYAGGAGMDPNSVFASLANMPHSGPGGFDFSQAAFAAAAAALQPPLPAQQPPPQQPALPQQTDTPIVTSALSAPPPSSSNNSIDAQPPRLHSPQTSTSNNCAAPSSPVQPARASSALAFSDGSKRRRIDTDGVALNGGATSEPGGDANSRQNGGGGGGLMNPKPEIKSSSTPMGSNNNGGNGSPQTPEQQTPANSNNGNGNSSPKALNIPGLTSTPLNSETLPMMSLPPGPMGPFPGPNIPGLVTSTPTHPSFMHRFPGPLPPGVGPFMRPPLASPGSMPFDGGFRTPTSYSYLYAEGQTPIPVPIMPEMLTGPGIPVSAKAIQTIEHGEVVCAVMVDSPKSHVYTGGKGTVKVWDISQSSASANEGHPIVMKTPLFNLDCLQGGHYIRSIKMANEHRMLVVGGESKVVNIWDLGGSNPRKKGEVEIVSQACYAIAISNDNKMGYFCQSDGAISVWDLHNLTLIHRLSGHSDGASCIDMNTDGSTLWTGGLDKTVRCWDIRETRSQITQLTFGSQVFSLAKSPTEDWVVTGMESDEIEIFAPGHIDRYQVKMHESCVLSLKFAHSGAWFASTGKDSWLHGWKPPHGANLFKVKENLSVLSCDLSADDRHLVTGSGDKRATVYEINY
nr:groucho 2 [Hymenolepis microstoma]